MNQTETFNCSGDGPTTSQALVPVSPQTNAGEGEGAEQAPSKTEVALKLRLAELSAELNETSMLLRTEIKTRKRLEVELHESEQRFMAFMDNSPAMTFIKNQNGEYLYGNKRWESFFSDKLAGAKERNDFLLYPP